MCSGIAFIVGLILVIKGQFRLSSRTVPKETGRILGVVLMLPMVAGFIAIFALGFDFDTETLDFNDPALLNATLVELGALVVALIIFAYTVYSLPQTPEPTRGASANTPQASPDVMTVAEAANYLRVSEDDVRRLIDEGKLPAARIGGSYRIAKIAIQDFLKNQS